MITHLIAVGAGVAATLAVQAAWRWVCRQFADVLEGLGDPVHGRSPVHPTSSPLTEENHAARSEGKRAEGR